VKALILVLYVACMLLIGYYSMRKTKSLSDFFLANRSLGPWVSAFAYGTTYFSAVLFIGYAGRIGWNFGLSSLWIVVGNTLIGSLLAWLLLAKKTRQVTEKLNVMTMPEFLGARYGDPYLKAFSAILVFVFLIPYSASVYMGLSYLFDVVMGIPYVLALLLIAVLTGVYLVMGGYFAVALTDLVQGSIMFFGAIFMVFYLLAHPQVGGLSGAISNLRAINPSLVNVIGPPGFWPLFGLVVLTSLGPWGLPQMVQKFYSLKSERIAFAATVVSTIFALVCAFSAYFSGSLTRLFFTELPRMGGVPNADLLMPNLIVKVMPQAFTLIFLLLVFSASMSTLSSLVLVSSSAVVVDLFPQSWRRNSLFWMRFLCGLFVFLSLLIAFKRSTFIVNLMSISWGATAGSFLAPYVYGLYWKRGTRQAAWTSMLSGLVIAVGFSWYFGFRSQLVPLVGSLAMLIPLGIFPVVSLFSGGER